MTGSDAQNDSQGKTAHPVAGGQIPGAPGMPAFVMAGTKPSAIPILIAAPHGGRAYTRALLQDLRFPESVLIRLEDRYVDRLARGVAAATGAALLLANAPRALIDLNRAPEDIDWDMFERDARPHGGPIVASRRARSGLGLIPRRLPGMGELWRRRHTRDDLESRLAHVHAPYHTALGDCLQSLRDRWGAALLIDLHSMPPISTRPGTSPPQIVLGDRFGAACHGSLVATAFAHFAQVGREAAHNRPYAGGYVLERHADPRRGIHAIQIEVDRTRYLDERMIDPGAGMDAVIDDLAALVRRLAGVVAELGQERGNWPIAAE